MTENNLPEPSSGEGLVKGGAALVRYQDDTMMGLALSRPRDVSNVRDDVLAEITAFPEYADRYYYSIPHRTPACGGHPTSKLCPHCSLVEGASIHAALAIQRAWGNCFSSWMPGDETPESLWIDGVFVDYERNVKWVRPTRFEKGYTTKGGAWVPLKGEKLVKAMNAAGSKAQRNAILAGVPDALKIMAFTKAKELVVGDDPGAPLKQKHVIAIVAEFAKFEVGLELLESKLGRPVDEWVMRDRASLLGLRTSLVEGHARDSLFGSTVRETQAKPVAPRDHGNERNADLEPLSDEDREKFRLYLEEQEEREADRQMAARQIDAKEGTAKAREEVFAKQTALTPAEDLPLEGTQETEPPEEEAEAKPKADIRIEPKEDLKKNKAKPKANIAKPADMHADREHEGDMGDRKGPTSEPDPFTANLFED